MQLTAKWIWQQQKSYLVYNQTVVARKTFRLPAFSTASLAITADSYYRVLINGVWVNDGPCRSWPEHFQYDVIDVTSYVQAGENEIRVIARHFGEGTFHQVPQQAGLLAQLDVALPSGKSLRVATDATWEVAEAKAWARNTPGVSIQMEPAEYYDARLDKRPRFAKAAVLCEADSGPWLDLNPRDCALLTRHPVALRRFVEANVVADDWLAYGFPVSRLLHPDAIYANHHASAACVIATVVVAKKAGHLRIEGGHMKVTVNGKDATAKGFAVKKGRNLLLLTPPGYFMQHVKDRGVRFVDTAGFTLENPLKPGHANPWCFTKLEDDPYFADDLVFMSQQDDNREAITADFNDYIEKLRKSTRTPEEFVESLGYMSQCLPAARMVMEDPHWQFTSRRVLASAGSAVQRPEALMHDHGESTVVKPVRQGDVELVYDLGQQNCGYWEIDLVAAAGTIVDVYAIEFVSPDGTLQHTWMNRNGLRYVCAEGVNRFTSLKRRSGRYLFITLRNQTKPVTLRNVRVTESTYPVSNTGHFACSDPSLDRIWEISARTLKLCMEDSFTDCPLYEQTLWVGDARNEALFAYTAFGANDLAQRCITIAGQSLERYPIVGCQVPSTWDCLLPAWSFLWGIMVWDNYFYSGDTRFLRKAWPLVKRNLKGAEELTNEQGLFSGPFWNMFDWTGVDDGHRVVLHNTMFAVGAVNAAIKCAKVLNDGKTAAWLNAFRARMVTGLNALWDGQKQAYPDSVHEDGVPSPRTCMHTSFLALLYDIVEKDHAAAAVKNTIDPPSDMIKVGSPFAILYLYEALDKAGLPDEIIRSIYTNYLPMIRAGATTVWETFPGGTGAPPGFPTRSHCHAWSAAPLHFLNAIVVGIRQTGVGGVSYDISPRVSGLTWAEGTNAGFQGPVRVKWEKDDKELHITATAPKGVTLRYAPNETHKGLRVFFNSRKVK